MIRQAIDRQAGIFTPDESDHLNVALSQINEKIRQIKTPVIGWHYDVQDILIDGSIDNNKEPIPVINVDNNVIEDASNG